MRGLTPTPRAALAHVELAETRHRHLAAAAQRVLDGREHRINRPRGILLGQIGAIGHLVDQLGLRHFALLVREPVAPTLTPHADGRIRKNTPMAIDRIAWIVTVLVALITALLLLLSGYTGYAGLGVAVAAVRRDQPAVAPRAARPVPRRRADRRAPISRPWVMRFYRATRSCARRARDG